MQKIALSKQGKNKGKYFALVDNKDFDWLNKWNWFLNSGYAVRKEKGKNILMHRLILNTPEGKDSDHINMNRLDNRCENLRIATRSENMMNGCKSNNTSGYKGVCWNKLANKWRVQIKLNRKNIFLGYFTNKLEAAHAYNLKAKELFGKFAYLNFH